MAAHSHPLVDSASSPSHLDRPTYTPLYSRPFTRNSFKTRLGDKSKHRTVSRPGSSYWVPCPMAVDPRTRRYPACLRYNNSYVPRRMLLIDTINRFPRMLWPKQEADRRERLGKCNTCRCRAGCLRKSIYMSNGSQSSLCAVLLYVWQFRSSMASGFVRILSRT
jgi:hypothetical protein